MTRIIVDARKKNSPGATGPPGSGCCDLRAGRYCSDVTRTIFEYGPAFTDTR
jgi:hypothetical protein